jgi:hypothetical protein
MFNIHPSGFLYFCDMHQSNANTDSVTKFVGTLCDCSDA